MTLTEMRSSSLSCPPRWSTPRTDRPTLGGRVAEVAERLGQPFMPWQRHVADVALEVDPRTGRLVYRRVGLLVPRQSGKTTELLAVMVHRALAFGQKQRQRISYTAQTRNDARHKWEDEHLVILDKSPYKRMYRTRKTNGSEAILWNNRSIHDLVASTQKAGHGPTLDLGVVDEAFAQGDWRVEQAMSPAMITRPEPQLWIVSTAGTADSVYLWSVVETGRARCDMGLTEGVCYFEWSAPDEASPGDPRTWWACMPALGHTVTEAAVQAEFDTMKLSEFKRAYLNQWTTTKADPVIPAEKWAACLDGASKIVGRRVFAVDVTPDHQWAAIAACGLRSDGLPHVEVVSHRAGTDWLPARLAELKAKWNPVAVIVDEKGPASSVVPDIEAKKVTLTKASASEHAQGCEMFYEAAVGGWLRHIGQADLTAASDGAVKAPMGDTWKWSRSSSAVDICPLVAVTLALWGFQTQKAPVGAGLVGVDLDDLED